MIGAAPENILVTLISVSGVVYLFTTRAVAVVISAMVPAALSILSKLKQSSSKDLSSVTVYAAPAGMFSIRTASPCLMANCTVAVNLSPFCTNAYSVLPIFTASGATGTMPSMPAGTAASAEITTVMSNVLSGTFTFATSGTTCFCTSRLPFPVTGAL